MRDLLTTQSQNCYKERINKEMMTRLAWKDRYAKLYPSTLESENSSKEQTQLPQLTPNTRFVAHPITKETGMKRKLTPSPPLPKVEEKKHSDALLSSVSPPSRKPWYSSHHGEGRKAYLKRRGHILPEERYEYPVLSSWEYGWRLGDYNLNYRTPPFARLSVVNNTFYARNGVFHIPSATDTVG